MEVPQDTLDETSVPLADVLRSDADAAASPLAEPEAALAEATSEPAAEAEPARPARRRSRGRGRRSSESAPAADETATPSDTGLASDLPIDAPPFDASAEEATEHTVAWLNGTVAEEIEESPSYEDETIAEDRLPEADFEGQEPTSDELDDEAEEEEGEEAAAPPRRGRRSAAADPIQVNVVVPRGLSRRVNSKLIQQAVLGVLKREGWEQPSTLDVLIVTDDEMREINVTRRGFDEATDVLSFPLLDLVPGQGLTQDIFVLPPEMNTHLGDIVISYMRVESQAEEGGHSREREWAFLTVHGALHILGYDHDTDERRRIMRRKEEDVLVELGLRRNGS